MAHQQAAAEEDNGTSLFAEALDFVPSPSPVSDGEDGPPIVAAAVEESSVKEGAAAAAGQAAGGWEDEDEDEDAPAIDLYSDDELERIDYEQEDIDYVAPPAIKAQAKKAPSPPPVARPAPPPPPPPASFPPKSAGLPVKPPPPQAKQQQPVPPPLGPVGWPPASAASSSRPPQQQQQQQQQQPKQQQSPSFGGGGQGGGFSAYSLASPVAQNWGRGLAAAASTSALGPGSFSFPPQREQPQQQQQQHSSSSSFAFAQARIPAAPSPRPVAAFVHPHAALVRQASGGLPASKSASPPRPPAPAALSRRRSFGPLTQDAHWPSKGGFLKAPVRAASSVTSSRGGGEGEGPSLKQRVVDDRKGSMRRQERERARSEDREVEVGPLGPRMPTRAEPRSRSRSVSLAPSWGQPEQQQRVMALNPPAKSRSYLEALAQAQAEQASASQSGAEEMEWEPQVGDQSGGKERRKKRRSTSVTRWDTDYSSHSDSDDNADDDSNSTSSDDDIDFGGAWSSKKKKEKGKSLSARVATLGSRVPSRSMSPPPPARLEEEAGARRRPIVERTRPIRERVGTSDSEAELADQKERSKRSLQQRSRNLAERMSDSEGEPELEKIPRTMRDRSRSLAERTASFAGRVYGGYSSAEEGEVSSSGRRRTRKEETRSRSKSRTLRGASDESDGGGWAKRLTAKEKGKGRDRGAAGRSRSPSPTRASDGRGQDDVPASARQQQQQQQQVRIPLAATHPPPEPLKGMLISQPGGDVPVQASIDFNDLPVPPLVLSRMHVVRVQNLKYDCLASSVRHFFLRPQSGKPFPHPVAFKWCGSFTDDRTDNPSIVKSCLLAYESGPIALKAETNNNKKVGDIASIVTQPRVLVVRREREQPRDERYHWDWKVRDINPTLAKAAKDEIQEGINVTLVRMQAASLREQEKKEQERLAREKEEDAATRDPRLARQLNDTRRMEMDRRSTGSNEVVMSYA